MKRSLVISAMLVTSLLVPLYATADTAATGRYTTREALRPRSLPTSRRLPERLDVANIRYVSEMH